MTKLTWQEFFEKIKEYIIMPQEFYENWVELYPNTPTELLMVKLTKKEQNIFDKMVEDYIITN